MAPQRWSGGSSRADFCLGFSAAGLVVTVSGSVGAGVVGVSCADSGSASAIPHKIAAGHLMTFMLTFLDVPRDPP